MLFNSLEFAIFCPIVSAFSFGLPYRFRTPIAMVCSCSFYMAFIPAYMLILAVTILIDHTAGTYLNVVRGKMQDASAWDQHRRDLRP